MTVIIAGQAHEIKGKIGDDELEEGRGRALRARGEVKDTAEHAANEMQRAVDRHTR